MRERILIGAVFLTVLWALNGLAQKEDRIIFSHKFHVEEQEIACVDCHQKATESTKASDVLVPKMQTCYDCHDEDETPCSTCHTNPDEPGVAPRLSGFKSRFPHKLHVDAEGTNCLTCHKGVDQAEQVGTFHLPSREQCTTCHKGADVATNRLQCFTCHQTTMNFTPISHRVNWRKDHGIARQIGKNSCIHCHQENYCITCHEGDNLDHQVHPLNFRFTHGMMAKGNKENCLTCHQEEAFCVDCHRSEHVMPKNHAMPNWSNRIQGDGGAHAREAQIDFETCLSCHNDAYADVVCTTCHGN
jgi:nitrate/TMAO reductase-like tetraheme cytochrome c subunit